MTKLVTVQDSEYKLSVSSGGKITFNTGDQTGEVVVTGDLTVLGNMTTVDTVNLEIEDNIILLNRGEDGTGITEGQSGIEIDRGTGPGGNALWVFDESVQWRDSQTSTTKYGAFTARHKSTNSLVGIETNSIRAGGYDLTLLGPDSSTAVVTVTGVADYEQRVIDYTAPGYPAKDDDIIPNIKAVIDYVTEYFAVNPPYKIQDSDNTSGSTILGDSILEIHDNPIDPGDSNLELILDGVQAAYWSATTHTVQDLTIEGTRIEVSVGAASNDLELASPGTGSVKIDDDLKLVQTSASVPMATDGTRIFANDEGQGGTGIFFVNPRTLDDATTTKDELVSRRKALAFSMIF
jgi:hypothetical protein